MNKLILTLIGTMMAGAVFAKLPSPTPEQAAKAEEAKAKTAWSNKVAEYKLCLSQDKVAARYLREKSKPKPGHTLAACQDPGPFNPPQVTASK